MSNNYEVDILINDKPIRKFAHQSRVFVESRNNQEYGIRIKNNGYTRIKAVVSVDGINVITGNPAGKDDTGYVIQGYSSYTVPGFRKSNETTTKFTFVTKDESYAKLSDETQGDTTNCGTIGVRIYAEKEKPTPEVIWRTEIVEKPVIVPMPYERPWPKYPPYYWSTVISDHTGNIQTSTFADTGSAMYKSTLGSAGGWGGGELRSCFNSSTAQSNVSNESLKAQQAIPMMLMNCSTQPTPNFDMGTKFTEKEVTDVVHDVEFETGRLLKTFEIFYASSQALTNMGVPMTKETAVAFPSAFPSRFCKPPRKS